MKILVSVITVELKEAKIKINSTVFYQNQRKKCGTQNCEICSSRPSASFLLDLTGTFFIDITILLKFVELVNVFVALKKYIAHASEVLFDFFNFFIVTEEEGEAETE